MDIEEPGALLRRLNNSREEHLQRLVTMLIVGLFPSDDSRLMPTPIGAEFLHRLDEKSFGERGNHSGAVFVDEFKLLRRADDTRDGSCDWAVLTDERVWMIELKTEHKSHDPPQLPWYLALARHNYPTQWVDLTYITGPHWYADPVLPPRTRYVHLTWGEVIPIIEDVWSRGAADEEQVVHRIVDQIRAIHEGFATPWVIWKADHLSVPSPIRCAVGEIKALDLGDIGHINHLFAPLRDPSSGRHVRRQPTP